MTFLTWDELHRQAERASGDQWRAQCQVWAAAARLGELKWTNPLVCAAFRTALEEGRQWEQENSMQWGLGEAYSGTVAQRVRIALAWIMWEAQDGKKMANNPGAWILGYEGEAGTTKNVYVGELLKMGVIWAQQEWEIVNLWPDYPMSADTWWAEWYYRHRPGQEERLRQLAGRMIIKTAPETPMDIAQHAFKKEAVELRELLRKTAPAETLVRIAQSAEMLGYKLGRGGGSFIDRRMVAEPG